jgi:hypothetical protein
MFDWQGNVGALFETPILQTGIKGQNGFFLSYAPFHIFLYKLDSVFNIEQVHVFICLMYGFLKKREQGSLRPIQLKRAETTKRVYSVQLSQSKEISRAHRGNV